LDEWKALEVDQKEMWLIVGPIRENQIGRHARIDEMLFLDLAPANPRLGEGE
jgi:hypothetical protein